MEENKVIVDQENKTVTIDTGVTDTQKSTKNRKQRRFEAKLARSKKQRRAPSVIAWVERTIRQFSGNKQVEEKVTSGALDKYLNK